MPRLPRIEYPGALYHVTARGVQQAMIFLDDHDRIALLKRLARTLLDGDASLFAYCLMGNHYHFVLQTRAANLSALMQRINGGYSLAFNQRHDRRGHVFEGRFKAIPVNRDAHLLEACRYVDLNPVRARLVESPAHWSWSSYRAHVGHAPVPAWLATAELHGALMGQLSDSESQTEAARRRYAAWAEAGRGVPLWKEPLRNEFASATTTAPARGSDDGERRLG